MDFLGLKIARLREVFFPQPCAVCGEILITETEAYYGLCTDCSVKFAISQMRRCLRCGKPLISEFEKCVSCRKSDDFAFDSAVVLYPYTGKYRDLLWSYKFEKRLPLGKFLAEKLACAGKFLPQESMNAVWVPVPPRPGKIKRTGWDQIEEMGRFLEKRLNFKISRCLKRLPSKSQKELNKKDRMQNLKGKIIAVKKPEKNVVLFDDVFTTGLTLSVCAEVLKSAGAEKVWGICAFYDE
jgi:ComF family protein